MSYIENANILALIVAIIAGCSPEEAFSRLDGKNLLESNVYDDSRSIRDNARCMGVSPTTAQKIKKDQQIGRMVQMSLF